MAKSYFSKEQRFEIIELIKKENNKNNKTKKDVDLTDLKIFFDEAFEYAVKSNATKTKQNKDSANSFFQPKEGLDKIVSIDYVSILGKIENELIERKYLSEQYQWIKNKTTLCEFLVVIMKFKYVRVTQFIKEIDIRRFFENRYRMEKNSLAEIFKPSKRPQFDRAIVSFHFMSQPRN